MRPSRSTSRLSADGADVAPALPAEAGPVLCALARNAIGTDLGVPPRPVDDHPWLAEPGATFVTLHLDHALRGCIGSLEARRPLRADVEANARAAAFGDPRFTPLSRAELDDVDLEVSVLSPVVALPVADRAEAIRALRPGVDGVVLTGAGRRATLLPQVWAQVGGADELLEHLVRKAGLPAGWWSQDVRLGRYTVAEYPEPR